MSPTIQNPAPVFSVTALVDSAFKEVSLADYLGQWVILMFYPLDFTFVCPTKILTFNDTLPKFACLNTTVLAISTDSDVGGLGVDLCIPLLADCNMRVVHEYGCLSEDKGITFRTSYLIDPRITMNDLPVGRSFDEVLRLVQAFQFTDVHSETIHTDPLAKLEYFATTANGMHEKGRANGSKVNR
ncbi:2-cysteine peroxiredoxin [Lactarius vividus]|nr:2-cysteine peroxiredoxin [Lactarius vividus]